MRRPQGSLIKRLESTPTYFTDVGARFGVTGADPCVCSLGREIADRLRTVQESAEAERQRLESVRTTRSGAERGAAHASLEYALSFTNTRLAQCLPVPRSARATQAPSQKSQVESRCLTIHPPPPSARPSSRA